MRKDTGRGWSHQILRQGNPEPLGAKQGSEYLALPWLNLTLLPLDLQRDEHLILEASFVVLGFPSCNFRRLTQASRQCLHFQQK